MMRRMELLAEDRDGQTVLRAPAVGTFTRAEPHGRVLTPGMDAGVLEVLEVPYRLVVPEGCMGRVVSERPERVHAPVGWGDVLYELEPLATALQDEISPALPGGSDSKPGDDLVAVRAPHGGRFWHRPAPGEPPLVSTGDLLAEGSSVGLIEVMKTFTHLHYHAQGALPNRARVVRLLADDGDEVREGDPLVELEPAD